ncbi:hypothetical protein CYD94_21695 (plasmid) [Ralstonia solanacearum]|nr:hypothetical protein CYD94_21695 [Ralstonia solanacearum]
MKLGAKVRYPLAQVEAWEAANLKLGHSQTRPTRPPDHLVHLDHWFPIFTPVLCNSACYTGCQILLTQWSWWSWWSCLAVAQYLGGFSARPPIAAGWSCRPERWSQKTPPKR